MEVKKDKPKRPVGRPPKREMRQIPDTPENIAKALFGIQSNNPEIIELRTKQE